MNWFERWTQQLLAAWRLGKSTQLQWQADNQAQIAELRQAQALAEQQQIAELQKRAAVLAHELEVLQVQHHSQLAMVKARCQQDLDDYRQYLKALDQLKVSLLNSYQHLPEAVAFTIHHHAKQLLNRMWEQSEPQQRIQQEMQLLAFITAVHEDSQAFLQGENQRTMPEKTLALLAKQESE